MDSRQSFTVAIPTLFLQTIAWTTLEHMIWTKPVLAVAVLLVASISMAQESPPATASVVIGGKKLTIAYSAPSVRGRKIMGGLVPYGRVWRTGADNATTFQTEADLDIGGLKSPKGTYTLYTLPGATEWQLIVNKQTGQWGTEYDPKRDVGRVKMSRTVLPAPLERLKIDLSASGAKAGMLKITWEKTEVSVPITLP